MDQINSRLTSLRLSGMSQCWKTLSETHKLNELSLADGMEMLLQSEEDQRSANRYARLLKNANFRYKASVEELNSQPLKSIQSIDNQQYKLIFCFIYLQDFIYL